MARPKTRPSHTPKRSPQIKKSARRTLRTNPAKRTDALVKGRSGSKQESVLAMLRRHGGTTIDAIGRATGWQAHSVRGFLAGVVRKKMKLNLASERFGDVRHYFIKVNGSSKSDSDAAKKAV